MSKHAAASPVSNRTYDVAKWVALVALPAFGAAYFGLGQIWGLPNPEEVVGSVVVLETLLGTLLGISNVRYNNSDSRFDGKVVVEDDEIDGPYLRGMELAVDDIDELAGRKELTLRVEGP